MKKQLLIVFVLFYSILGFSQGIEFEHGTWKEVLEKAKLTSKPIFIDVYTSWCGPCKKMNAEVFPLEEVGKVFNANFICYKINAEEGEGIEIAKKYGVTAFPTYLYLNPEGILFFRGLGYMVASRFIAQSQTALPEMLDKKSIDDWKNEYHKKKNDTTFLTSYIEKCSKLDLPVDTIFDEYLQLLSETERYKPAIAKMYEHLYIEKRLSMSVTSTGYKNIEKHIKEFEKLFENKAYVNIFLVNGINQSIYEAGLTKNEKLFQEVIKSYDSLPKDNLEWFKDELYMRYYSLRGEMVNYTPYAIRFTNEYLMKITNDEIEQKGKADLQDYENKIKSGEIDTTKVDAANLASTRVFWKNFKRNRVSESLNKVAWAIFLYISDHNALKEALSWSNRSLELSPNSSTFLDTNANLLYKLGNKEMGISKEKEALKYVDKKNSKEYEETLSKIQAGEKTWK